MTTVLAHMPEDPAERIRFCAVNSREYPHLTKEAIKQVNELKKCKSPSKLEAVLNAKLDGWTLLHYAVEFNNVKLCKALLETGANPNIPDKSGTQSLHLAARHGHNECIKALLDNDADLLAMDALCRTPCLVALHHYKNSAVAILKLVETKSETIVPVVVENQHQIENCATEIDSLKRDVQAMQLGRKTDNDPVPSRQRTRSEAQCEATLQAIQLRITQLENNCAMNKSEIFGREEQTVAIAASIPTTGDASQPKCFSHCGVKGRVRELENRLTALEKIVSPMQSPKDEEGSALVKNLRGHFCKLVETLNVEEYLNYLFQEEALEITDLGNVKAKHSSQERAEEMMLRLFDKKNTTWVYPFLQRLQKKNRVLFQMVDCEHTYGN